MPGVPARRASGGPLLGDVEVGAERQPHPRHLGLRRPGQRGQELGRPVERRGRHGVTARLERGARRRAGARRPAADGRRAQRVRQPAQVGRRAQQPGDPGRARPVPAARHDRDPPEPGRQAALQLGVPFLEPSRLGRPLREPVGRPLGDPLPQPDLLRQRPQLGRGHRLGGHQPAERPGPAAEQPLVERQPGLAGRPGPPAPGSPVSPGSASSPSLIPAISRQQPTCPSSPASSAGGSAVACSPRRLAGLLSEVGCWRAIAGISDGLLCRPAVPASPASRRGRRGGAAGLSLDEGLLGSWTGPFGWLVVAEPVAPAHLRALSEEAGLRQRLAEGSADRFPDRAAQALRLKGRHAELQRGVSAGLWRITIAAGGRDAASAARVAGLLCASVDLGGLPYALCPAPDPGPGPGRSGARRRPRARR